jgi:hypothetical protein
MSFDNILLWRGVVRIFYRTCLVCIYVCMHACMYKGWATKPALTLRPLKIYRGRALMYEDLEGPFSSRNMKVRDVRIDQFSKICQSRLLIPSSVIFSSQTLVTHIRFFLEGQWCYVLNCMSHVTSYYIKKPLICITPEEFVILLFLLIMDGIVWNKPEWNIFSFHFTVDFSRPYSCRHIQVRRLLAGFPPQLPWFETDLWWTKWHWGRFSPRTFVSPSNFHSTYCSTLIIYGPGTKWTRSHATPRN